MGAAEAQGATAQAVSPSRAGATAVIGAHDSSRLGFSGGLRFGGLGVPFDLEQIRPDQMPGLLTQCPAPQRPASNGLATHGLRGIHVPSAGQALVEVLLVDVSEGRKAASLRRCDFCAHALHGSDSLENVQAISYGVNRVVFPSEALDNAGVETNNERRLRKLIEVCAAHGGHVAVAKAAKLNPATLDQILKKVPLPPKKGDGSRSERALGDPAARAIEEAYGLGRGWFDNDGDNIDMNPKELQLLGLFRELDPVLQGVIIENVREAVEQRARMAERMRESVREKPGGGIKPPDREQLVPAPATKRRAKQ